MSADSLEAIVFGVTFLMFLIFGLLLVRTLMPGGRDD